MSRFTGRARRAIGQLVLTGGAQAGIQVIGFITGLIVIRALPVSEYAYYTLATAALGTMTVLTDCGVSQAVLRGGGRVWQSRALLGGIVNGGLRLRRRFAVGVGAAFSVVLPLLLLEQGATPTQSVLVTAAVIPLFASAVSAQIYEIVPRLQQQLAPLQGIQLSGVLLRLAAVTGAAYAYPAAWLATAAAGVAQIWATWRTRRLAARAADLDASCSPDAESAMIAMIRKTAPSAIYYAFAGQVSVWLISLFGETENVAQVGALGRLAMVFNILSTVFALILVPRFARMGEGRDTRVLRRFWIVQVAALVLLAAIVGAIARYPTSALAVLGDDYRLLSVEVVLMGATGAMALMAGGAYSLAAARGIVIAPGVVIATAVALQIALAVVLPISTVAGVLWLGLISNVVFWLMHTINFSRSVLQ